MLNFKCRTHKTTAFTITNVTIIMTVQNSFVISVILAFACVVHSGTEDSEGDNMISSSSFKPPICTTDCLAEKLAKELRTECPDISRQILRNHLPAANRDAGDYVPFKEIKTIESCTRKCCSLLECNFAFFFNDTCLTLSCTKGQDSCVPKQIPAENVDKIGGNISMVLVRTPTGMARFQNCEVGVTRCGVNQDCVSVNSKNRNGICKCSIGFTPNLNGNCVLVQTEGDDETTNSPQALLSSTLKSVKILEVLVESKNVTLPENEVTLIAQVIPPEQEGVPYSYEWKLISHPMEDGTTSATSEGQTTGKLHLMGLKQGSYIYQVDVRSLEANGSANATIFVSPANRINLAPVAVISPPEQNVQLPTASVVLDASSSTDDDKIVSYKWELQKGPIEFLFSPKKNVNSTTLQIENLIPGNYTFKLTVEDADHAVNSTTANITVIKETDYPPTANAGQDIVIYLPQSEVTLNGNASTDDKKIVQWEWKATGDLNKAVDMQDTHTPYLKLSHLQEGFFTFELKVTDEGGLSSTSTVHVVVKPASGNPPKANAGPDATIALPTTWAVLDASDSKSDNKIVKWNWTQISGPSNSVIIDADKIKSNVSGLTKGEYEFQLEIEDESKLSGKDLVKIIVMQRINEPPTAVAGGDKTVILPLTLVKLDGSGSKDDVKITDWKWERQATSLAAGVILEDSDKSPILQLTDMVAGKYVFKLTVKDEQGLSDENIVTLTVQEDARKKDLLEVIMAVSVYSLSESDKEKILQQMTLLLHDVRLDFDTMRSQINTDYAVLILHGVSNKNGKIIEGTKLASQLRQRLHQDDGLLQFPIVSIDTVECLDVCSGHGVCQDTANGRQCICDAFWMENFLKIRLGNGDRNCEWSKIYVGVITCFLLMMVMALLWSLVFLFRRNLGALKENLGSPSSGSSNGSARGGKRYHSHKKQYTLLDDDEIEMELKADEGEADEESEDSDSDILFETKRPKGKNGISKKMSSSSSNGSVRNGILKHSRRIKA